MICLSITIPTQQTSLGPWLHVAKAEQKVKEKGLERWFSRYMATRGGAETLHLENTIGSIAPGYEADLTVLDLKPDRFAAWRLNFAESITEKLFVLSTIAPGFTVKATYVAGRKVYDRERKRPLMYASDPDIS